LGSKKSLLVFKIWSIYSDSVIWMLSTFNGRLVVRVAALGLAGGWFVSFEIDALQTDCCFGVELRCVNLEVVLAAVGTVDVIVIGVESLVYCQLASTINKSSPSWAQCLCNSGKIYSCNWIRSLLNSEFKKKRVN
jgi:hypothetical protein